MPRLIDLTLPLREGSRGIAWEPARTLEKDGWNARTLHLYSHAGTHMDAPVHFGVGTQTIDQIPLQSCMGRAHLADLTPTQPSALLSVAALGETAEQVEAGDMLLLRTDWSRFAQETDGKTYRDALPRISEELAHWCVRRGVKLLGVEPPSVADVHQLPEVTRIHRILFEGGVVIVEGLRGLDLIRNSPCFFAALPLPVTGGDGCLCRAFAIDDVTPETTLADLWKILQGSPTDSREPNPTTSTETTPA